MIIKIKTDTFFITERLKEVDKNYFIVFNTHSKKYEIHYKGQANGTFCVGLPFTILDERAIDYVLKTRVENIDKIIKDIEKNNKKIEKEKNSKILDFAKEMLK